MNDFERVSHFIEESEQAQRRLRDIVIILGAFAAAMVGLAVYLTFF